MTVCGGKKRGGGLCQRPAGWGTDHVGIGYCKLHNGNVPKGVGHHEFKHGGYSKYAGTTIAEKMATFPEGEALSLLSELTLMRGLLAAFLDKFKDSQSALASADSISAVTLLVDNIRKITDSMVKQRNDTALTAVELAFIINRLPDIVVKYVDTPDKQQQFLSELFGVVGRTESSDATALRITADAGHIR